MLITTDTHDVRTRATVTRVLAAGYALLCYLAFLAVFGYAVAFLADVAVPRTIDRGGPAAGTVVAAVVDLALLGVFAVQHSVMARPAFKRRWATVVPPHLERSTFVLVASAVLALVFWQWRPIPAVVWDVPGPGARGLLWAAYGVGWLWVLAMTFAIDHLDFVGVRQVARHARGLAGHAPAFALPLPHRLVRHPMMIGFFPAFLATPTMTLGHLLFAGLGCGYVLMGVRLEERDLTRALPPYAAYAAVTPRFVPRLVRPRALVPPRLLNAGPTASPEAVGHRAEEPVMNTVNHLVVQPRDQAIARDTGTTAQVLPLRPATGPRPDVVPVRLPGGRVVELRPLQHGERAPLLAVFEGMSSASRARRYLTGMVRLPSAMLGPLTDVDGHRHVAWLASADGRPVGIARYVLDGVGVAEVAVEVVDDHHGLGIGSALLDAVTTVAAARSVRRVRALLTPDNEPSRRLATRIGVRLQVVGDLLEGVGQLRLLDPARVDRQAVLALAGRAADQRGAWSSLLPSTAPQRNLNGGHGG